MVQAIEQGYVQCRIEQAAYDYGQSLETGARTIVGVNKFRDQHEPEADTFLVPKTLRKNKLQP